MDLFGSTLPEPDFSEGPAPVRADYPKLYGHANALTQLFSRIDTGNPPASLIIQGEEGIGKATFVTHFICRLFNMPYPKPSTSDESRWANMAHPDLLIVERGYDDKKGEQKADIVREDVAGVVPFLRRTASRGGYRIVVVDDANRMNMHAQNTLLKILEEPPAKTIIILITHSLGQLIQTIRSRCQVLRLNALKDEDVHACLAEAGIALNSADKEFLLSYAAGAPGRIIQLTEFVAKEGVTLLFSCLNTAHGIDRMAALQLADKLAAHSHADTIYTLLDFVLGRVALSMAGDTTALTGLLKQFTPQTLQHMEMQGSEKIVELQRSLAAFVSLCQHAKLDKKHTAYGVVQRLSEGL